MQKNSCSLNLCRDGNKSKKVKKEVDLYSAFIVVPHTQGKALRYGSHSFYLQITPHLPLPRKRSPDGASPDWGCRHLIAAYYSFIYPKGWKAESAWLADLQRTVYIHKCQHTSAAGRAQDSESSPVKDWRSTTVPRNQPKQNVVHGGSSTCMLMCQKSVAVVWDKCQWQWHSITGTGIYMQCHF